MTEYDGRLVVPAALRGYRCWRLKSSKDRNLYPIHADASGPWPRRRVTAHCDSVLRPAHMVDHNTDSSYSSPSSRCTCGFYATYDHEYYRGHLPKMWDAFNGKPHIFIHGSIVATGHVILGTRGFRAQYAQIEALWGLLSFDIAKYYNVPWFLTRREFLKRYPPHNVAELLEGVRES